VRLFGFKIPAYPDYKQLILRALEASIPIMANEPVRYTFTWKGYLERLPGKVTWKGYLERGGVECFFEAGQDLKKYFTFLNIFYKKEALTWN